MKKINGAVLCSLINSAYLGGVIEEAVLTVSDRNAKIMAVDLTRCLLVSSSVPFALDAEDITLGLPDLKLLSKILNEKEDILYEISEQKEKHWMKLSIKNKGNVKLLLNHPELITTRVTNPFADDELLHTYTIDMEFSAETIDKVLYFVNHFKPLTLVFHLLPDGTLTVRSDINDKQQFFIDACDTGDRQPEIKVRTYTQHVVAVLKHIKTILEPDESVVLALKDDENPIIFLYNNYLCAFSPIKGTGFN